MEATIRGRDLVTGLPREVVVTDADIRDALSKSVKHLVRAVKEVRESTPPELISDIMNRGIVLAGGGASLKGLDKILELETKIPVRVAEDPFTAVVRGCGIILEDVERLSEVLVENETEVSPQ